MPCAFATYTVAAIVGAVVSKPTPKHNLLSRIFYGKL